MSKPTLTAVELQIRRVTRRLFVQTFLDRLAWCWAGALALAAAWLLAQPLLLPGAAALAAIGFFYDPGLGTASPNRADKDRQAASARDVDEKLADLKKKLAENWPKDQPKGPEVKELEKLLDKLLSQPLDPK